MNSLAILPVLYFYVALITSPGYKNLPPSRRPRFDSWVKKFPRRDRLSAPVFLGFPGGSNGKESACNLGQLGSVPRLGRSPGEGPGNPLQYFCLENHHGQRSLAGCSPWGHKESETTKRLSSLTSWYTMWVIFVLVNICLSPVDYKLHQSKNFCLLYYLMDPQCTEHSLTCHRWDDWMASLTQQMWVLTSSGRW